MRFLNQPSSAPSRHHKLKLSLNYESFARRITGFGPKVQLSETRDLTLTTISRCCMYERNGCVGSTTKMCSVDTKKSRRYLRARNYDPQAAFKQYSTTASWRETLRLNDTYDNADVSNFEATRRLVTLPRTLPPHHIISTPPF
jgi:hypothetical protein